MAVCLVKALPLELDHRWRDLLFGLFRSAGRALRMLGAPEWAGEFKRRVAGGAEEIERGHGETVAESCDLYEIAAGSFFYEKDRKTFLTAK
ncbi:hypothetical protein A2881_03585 [Candidatus Peribacteria bacterium RIFCSPHIGHO2_01_FULL_55_13]|nr:MAG: hypothetical protein A2881_03585 [Candidatus Peribacteria bacterium RIFCSPHIGHO2_01_FULL_55_13]OGJ66662.1 MAG: hypothetical protein A3F36_02830 [Candidatus Peribacteria bacterium RIFCSPHIGHO2_12_FULL_55_11]